MRGEEGWGGGIETYSPLFQQCYICEFFYIKGFFIQNNIFNDLYNKSIIKTMIIIRGVIMVIIIKVAEIVMIRG